jgi:glycerol-3-phosphate dehydrogenase
VFRPECVVWLFGKKQYNGGCNMYDVAIIGAGVIGTYIARELSRYKLKIALLEKDNDVANGTTKANSAIVHAGFDAKPNTLKARMNVQGNTMFDEVCKELHVPFKRIGSIVVAFSEEELETLKELYDRGIENNVPGLKILSAEELIDLEPNINCTALGALYAPTAGIIGPWELAMALAENAVDNGVELFLNTEVTGIEKKGSAYTVKSGNGTFEAKYVINCGGVYADKIHNMIAPAAFEIIPRRGQYFLLDKSAGTLVNTVVFQCPTKLGKGVVVLPTVHGNLLIGPDAEDIQDRDDTGTSEKRLNIIRETAKKTSEKIQFGATITSFAGLRATPLSGDFIIEESAAAKGFFDVAGIESPGLSSAPAIAQYVVGLVKERDGQFETNYDFKPTRREPIHFMHLSESERQAVIKKDPRYGRIICRCENITEGEIVDAIKRSAGGRTIDGIKRRVRPGMGRCQGGFCEPRVIEILARECGINMMQVVKDGPDSNIATAETKAHGKA